MRPSRVAAMADTSPTPDAFREAASRFATGITVVTCVDAHGVDHAMTASSFVAVSIDPPLVLICVERASRFHAAISSTDQWVISVLAEQARGVARWLATKGRPLMGQLDRVPHRRADRSGIAVLDHSLAALHCRRWACHDGGDHDIVVGLVEAVDAPVTDALPLAYFRRAFRGLPQDIVQD